MAGLTQVKTLKLEVLAKEFTPEKVSVFNVEINRLESYEGYPVNPILQKYLGPNWRKSFAVIFNSSDKYNAHIETYKFEERKAYLAFRRTDQKAFTSIFQNKGSSTKLGPLYLIWKEAYGKKKKNRAAKRKHHWVFKVLSMSLMEKLPPGLLPKTESDQNTWGMKNFFKACIHCHKIDGIGGEKSFDIARDKMWRTKGKEWITKYIHNPRLLNPSSKMPMFPMKVDMRKERIQNIVSYILDITDENIPRSGIKKRRKSKSKALQRILDNNRL